MLYQTKEVDVMNEDLKEKKHVKWMPWDYEMRGYQQACGCEFHQTVHNWELLHTNAFYVSSKSEYTIHLKFFRWGSHQMVEYMVIILKKCENSPNNFRCLGAMQEWQGMCFCMTSLKGPLLACHTYGIDWDSALFWYSTHQIGNISSVGKNVYFW